MAYKTATQAMKDMIDDHTKKISDQESITKFFTIIVAVTLVSTLVGIAGLYINAIYESRSYQINIKEISELQKEVNSNKELLNQYKIKMEILKSKYPWINEITQ